MIFYHAIRYDIDAICKTPLRTGNADADIENVLRRSDGKAILQASSIAGAMRNWLETKAPKETDRLFGNNDQEGELTITDGVFDENSIQDIRPRLKIDSPTGTASNKFDIAAIRSGASFSFTIFWKGLFLPENNYIEEILGAIHKGLIRFGAQKSTGFGKVELTIKKQTYNMKNKADRELWLKDQKATQIYTTVCTLTEKQSQVTFTVYGKSESILTKSSFATHTENGSVTKNIQEGNQAILTGASVKGAVRARVKAIIDLGNFAIDQSLTEQIFGSESSQSDSKKKVSGQAIFSDVYLKKNDNTHNISRIRIDRFTGGVMNKNLITEEPISSDVKIEIVVPCDDAICCLMLFALRDLGLGLYTLGSGSAIGRGHITINKIVASVFDKEIVMTFNKGVEITSGEDIAKKWLAALKEESK